MGARKSARFTLSFTRPAQRLTSSARAPEKRTRRTCTEYCTGAVPAPTSVPGSRTAVLCLPVDGVSVIAFDLRRRTEQSQSHYDAAAQQHLHGSPLPEVRPVWKPSQARWHAVSSDSPRSLQPHTHAE